MLKLILENVITDTQKSYYCEHLSWTSYDGHPVLLICKLSEYIEIDLLKNRPISITEVTDTQEETELKLFDFLFDKKFDKIT